MFTIPNNRCQKSWSIHFQRRWKRLYQRITVQLTNLLQLLCPVLLPKLAKGSLSGLNHVIQFLFPCCQFSNSLQIKLFLVQNAVLWRRRLKADPPEFSTTNIFINTTKGNGRLCAWKCFGFRYGQLGIGFHWLLYRKVIWSGDKRWRATHRRGREGKFCRLWCWMWVWRCCTESRNYHHVQAYTFSRCKISLWKMPTAYNLPGLWTVQHNQTVCPQLSPTHKRKSTEYNYSVIHWLMSYMAFTMLTDL